MISSAQLAIKQISRATRPTASNAYRIIARTQASSADASEYEQIMRMGVSSSSQHSSKSPTMSRAYGASTAKQASQQAVSSAYRSVTEPSMYEDYDLYEMHHKPSEGTQFTHYNASYDPYVNGGETGSVI